MEQWQRYAVAALIGECEAIAASGRLTPPAEQSLRLLIAKTSSVFQMQVHERELSIFDTYERDLSVIRQCMERVS